MKNFDSGAPEAKSPRITSPNLLMSKLRHSREEPLIFTSLFIQGSSFSTLPTQKCPKGFSIQGC